MTSYLNDPVISRTKVQLPEWSGGVYGESNITNGVRGVTYAASEPAVYGVSENHTSDAGPGLYGQSDAAGVWGNSQTWHGVYGETASTTGGAGVWGEQKGTGSGVVGKSSEGRGVEGYGIVEHGVFGQSEQGAGVAAMSTNGIGVLGRGGKLAGRFEGDVEVTGDIRLPNADCAEEFDVRDMDAAEPGTVMVLDDDGGVRPSDHAYDKRVAGVISGAGAYRPGIVLDKQELCDNRMPIALLGKVFCKVDAQFGAIGVGDLLTTSETPGHAMRVDQPLQAFGAVIGKALRPLSEGQALIPILIALQ